MDKCEREEEKVGMGYGRGEETGVKENVERREESGVNGEEGKEDGGGRGKLGRRFRGTCPWRLKTPQPLTNKSSTLGRGGGGGE